MSEDDVERLGGFRDLTDEVPSPFATIWQATDNIKSALNAFEDGLDRLMDAEQLAVRDPEGYAVEVDLEAERQKILTYLERLRGRIEAIEAKVREDDTDDK